MERHQITSLVQAVRHYFEIINPDDGSTGFTFLREYKALSEKDKVELKEMLKGIGYINLI